VSRGSAGGGGGTGGAGVDQTARDAAAAKTNVTLDGVHQDSLPVASTPVTPATLGLGNVANLTPQNYPTSTAQAASVLDITTKRVVRFGLYKDPADATEPAYLESVAGESTTAQLFFYSYANTLDSATLTATNAAGRTPVIGWMPQDGTNATSQPSYSLANITAGNFDSYMTTFLNAVKALGFPVMIRWAHEMNGNWYPWSEGVNGNTTGQYVTAWRHVRNLATSLGVTNVQWVWTPTTNYSGSTPLAGLYPGDAYVDIVSMNGYNWGAAGSGGWRTPSQVFASTYSDINAISPYKPFWITEVGCAPDDGGSKATWYGQFFTWLLSTRITGFLYFEVFKSTVTGEKDWRVGSSTGSAAAFTSGVISLRASTRKSGVDARSLLATATDLGGVVQQISYLPSLANGLWGSGGAESMSRLGLSEIPSVSGRVSLTHFTAPVTVSINTLAFQVGGAAATGTTLARVGIYLVNSDGSVTLVGRTASNTALGNTTYSSAQQGLDATGGYPTLVTLNQGQRYAFALLFTGTGMPNIKGMLADLATLPPYVCRYIDGQADMAASYTNAQLVNDYRPLLVGGVRY
jgi:hypothetical protein